MNTNQLRIFRAVAETENYSRAAQQLYMSQPNVYIQVRNLEKALGCRLFEQMERRAVLTEAGRALLEYAVQMLDLEEDAGLVLEDLRHQHRSRLGIAASPAVGSYLLPSTIASFRARYPDVHITLDTYSLNRELREEALRFDNDLFFATMALPTPYTVSEEIWRSDLALCAGASHPLARPGPVAVEELAGEEFIWLQYATATRRTGEAALKKLGVNPRPGMVVSNAEAAKQILMHGCGVAVLPRLVVRDEIGRGQVRVLDLPGFHVEYPVRCVRHKAKTMSPQAEAFLGLAKEMASSGAWN